MVSTRRGLAFALGGGGALLWAESASASLLTRKSLLQHMEIKKFAKNLQERGMMTGFCEGTMSEGECQQKRDDCKSNCEAEKDACNQGVQRCKSDIENCKSRKRNDRNRCKNSCGGRWRAKMKCRRNCRRNNRPRDCGSSFKCNKICQSTTCKLGCPKAAPCKVKAKACETWNAAMEFLRDSGFGAMVGLAKRGLEVDSVEAYSSMFPEPNQAPGYPEAASEYKANPELKKLIRFQLAITMAGYEFEDEENGANFQPVTPKSPSEPSMFCDLGEDLNEDTYSEVYSFSVKKGTHDTQGSAYVYDGMNETIVTMNFRGSETPDFSTPKSHIIQSLSQARDWLGTDFVFFPVDDSICNNPGTLLHKGFRNAYQDFVTYSDNGDGKNWIDAVRSLIEEYAPKAETEGKKFKFMISGHSLGGALAALATYDTWCNKHFHAALGYADGENTFLKGPFTVTYGEAFPFWGLNSVGKYAETVPITQRVRVNTCGQRGQVFGGDTVGSVTNFYEGGDNGGWRHTKDGDFQCAWVSRTAGDSSCVGLPGTFLCHLLDRYLEGTFNAGPTDTLGNLDNSTEKRHDMTGICAEGMPAALSPSEDVEMPGMWFVDYTKAFLEFNKKVKEVLLNPDSWMDAAKSQWSNLWSDF